MPANAQMARSHRSDNTPILRRSFTLPARRFACSLTTCVIIALLAGCQANWMSPAQPQTPLKHSQTKVQVTVAAPRTQPAPATRPDVADERAAQLTQEIQEYVNNLAMDDLQAKLSRHEGRPGSPMPAAAESPAAEPTNDPAAVAANPAPVAPPAATSAKESAVPAAPAGPAPVAQRPVAANPRADVAGANQHVPLQPEVIVPGAADQAALRPPTPALSVPAEGTPASSRVPAKDSSGRATVAGPLAASPSATPPQTGPQVVSIDISPAVLSTLATQPNPRAVQPRTNQPAAVKPGPSDDLKHLIDQLRKEATDRPDSVGAALRLRLAEWSLLGTVSPAEWPLQDADKRKLAQSVWQVLQVVSKMEASPQGAPGDEFQKAIESLTETLQQVQPLQIPAALLCRSVSSFGNPDTMPEPWQFAVGRTSMVVLYCELAGFKSEPVPAKANQYHTLLSQRLAILTAAGKELWNFEDQQIEDFCRRPRRDFFITKLLKIPPELPAGDYVLKVTIRDKLANRVAETNVPFGITLVSSGNG